MPRRSAEDTTARREHILDLAMDEASASGLEGLTIGRLSTLADMSKSGLFAHFGSKEELQVATIEHAQQRFRERVWDRVDDTAPGVLRLRAMVRQWIDHIETDHLRGGCFFAAASAEFDGRPGGVREHIMKLVRSWVHYLEREVEVARKTGQLLTIVKPDLLAFDLHASVQEANLYRQLFEREDAFDLARLAVDAKLVSACTAEGRALMRDATTLNKR